MRALPVLKMKKKKCAVVPLSLWISLLLKYAKKKMTDESYFPDCECIYNSISVKMLVVPFLIKIITESPRGEKKKLFFFFFYIIMFVFFFYCTVYHLLKIK